MKNFDRKAASDKAGHERAKREHSPRYLNFLQGHRQSMRRIFARGFMARIKDVITEVCSYWGCSVHDLRCVYPCPTRAEWDLYENTYQPIYFPDQAMPVILAIALLKSRFAVMLTFEEIGWVLGKQNLNDIRDCWNKGQRIIKGKKSHPFRDDFMAIAGILREKWGKPFVHAPSLTCIAG